MDMEFDSNGAGPGADRSRGHGGQHDSQQPPGGAAPLPSVLPASRSFRLSLVGMENDREAEGDSEQLRLPADAKPDQQRKPTRAAHTTGTAGLPKEHAMSLLSHLGFKANDGRKRSQVHQGLDGDVASKNGSEKSGPYRLHGGVDAVGLHNMTPIKDMTPTKGLVVSDSRAAGEGDRRQGADTGGGMHGGMASGRAVTPKSPVSPALACGCYWRASIDFGGF